MRFLLAFAFACFALPAAAQSDGVLTGIRAEPTEALIRETAGEFGLTAVTRVERVVDSTYVIPTRLAFGGEGAAAADTLLFFASLDACTGPDCATLSVVAFFGAGGAPDQLVSMNAWNAQRRFTRAYVDGDQVALQSDLDLSGGVTEASVRVFFRTYLLSLAAFISEPAGPEGAPPSE